MMVWSGVWVTAMKIIVQRLIVVCLSILCLLPALVDGAMAEKRLALVIGIDDYKEVPKLTKAIGDANAIGDKLTAIGFTVSRSINPDRRALSLALANFYSSIEPGDTALIHYSGHGVEIKRENYLLPADIPNPDNGSAELLTSEAIALASLVDTLQDKGANVRILIIDACRDNPFAASGKRALGTTRGLAAVAPPKGSFIMYSAGTGQAALDRLSDTDPSTTSVFTRVLLTQFDKKGLLLRDMASGVRTEVNRLAKTVGHEQFPAYYDEMTVDFTFLPGDGKEDGQATIQQAVITPTPPVPPPAITPKGIDEEKAYKMSETIDTVDAWNIFLKQYPDGPYSPYAMAAREKLVAKAVPRAIAIIEQPAPKIKTPKIITPQPAPPKKKVVATGCSGSGRVRGLPPDDNFLAVRTGPGTSFTEVSRLFNGDRVSVCGKNGKWLRINGSGASGWVFGKYVAVGG